MATVNPKALRGAVLASNRPPFRILQQGEVTLNSSSSTVTHNLGYPPIVKIWAYQKSSTELGQYQQVSTYLVWHWGFVSTPDVTYYITDNDVVFTNNINGPITIIYRIYTND